MSGTGGDRRNFDPRFDPAFQPGYDPRNDPSIAARTDPFGAGTYRGDPVRSDPAPPPVGIEVPEPSRTSGRRAAPTEHYAAAATADEPAPRGVNPFLAALWVLSFVLLVTGIATYRSIPGLEQLVNSGDPEAGVSYFGLFAISAISAVLIGVGLAAAAGALAVHAVRWTGRRSREAPDADRD